MRTCRQVKPSANDRLDKALVGRRVRVLSTEDDRMHAGKVVLWCEATNVHIVRYDTGKQRVEQLNNPTACFWELEDHDQPLFARSSSGTSSSPRRQQSPARPVATSSTTPAPAVTPATPPVDGALGVPGQSAWPSSRAIDRPREVATAIEIKKEPAPEAPACADSALLTWVQCERCSKWRKVSQAPAAGTKWHCELNADAAHNSCAVPEEGDDDSSSGENYFQVSPSQ